MKILWVKSGPLFPLNTGGRRRTHAMLQQLAQKHHLTYLAMLPEGQELTGGEEDAPYAQEKIWIPTMEPGKKSLRFVRDLATNLLFSTRPYVLDRYRSLRLSEELRTLDATGEFDLIICDFLTPAVNFDFDQIETPSVLFQHNIEAQIWRRLAAEQSNPVSRLYFREQFLRMKESERLLSEKFDGVITVSPEDATRCRDDYSLENVLGAVPTGVDTKFFAPPVPRSPEKGVIGFLGSMDWMPNVECVQHFCSDIFPAILAKRPEARFKIIGRDPSPAVLRLAETFPNVEVTGTVEDVRPHLDSCEVLVVPLRSGGGTRIKIFEAMAQGVPVVSTTIGAEGLPVQPEETILIADRVEDFSAAVLRVLDSPDLRAKLSSQARKKLVQEHSWSSVCSTFTDLCDEVFSLEKD